MLLPFLMRALTDARAFVGTMVVLLLRYLKGRSNKCSTCLALCTAGPGFHSRRNESSLWRCCVQDLGFPVWIMGVVSGCALGVSFILAVLYLCVTIFSGARRHFRYISTPAA